jgi:hypothetical protein
VSEPKSKSFAISKWAVWEAYRKVKANKGAAGVDGGSIAEFEQDLHGNLYKLWNRLELYPDVVDACEGEGGVPSRLLKTDAGVGRQEGTPWMMFAGSPSGRRSMNASRSMGSLVRARVG